MLYVDIPTLPEFKALSTVREDASVLGVRKEDIPGGAHLAAILRYPI
jgi:hypothetical protein